MFIVIVHPSLFVQRLQHCAETVHAEIPSEEYGIITNSYYAAMFTIVQNCLLSLFIVLL